MKAPISHATASCPDYKVHAVHFSEHGDMLSKDDKYSHKQVARTYACNISLWFCNSKHLDFYWGIKSKRLQLSAKLKYQEIKIRGSGYWNRHYITYNITKIQS